MTIGNITTYNDTSVTPGITYYYKVSAVNGLGEGPMSNEASATPPNVPFAPQNLTAESGVGYVDLAWGPPISDGGSPITNYKIYRGLSSGSETLYEIIGVVTIYNDTSVTLGTTYYYRVRAVNIIGDGPLSNEAFATPPTVPSAPLNLTASSGDNYVNLTWDEPVFDGGSPIIGYYIYRDGFVWRYDVVSPNQLWYNDTNVSNGVTYTYNVSALNDVGEGPFSTGVNSTPMTVPSAVQNLTAHTGNSYINLTWEVPASNGGSPIIRYYIYRNGTIGSYALVPAGQLWYNDTNVFNGINYTYNVSAVNSVGEGPNSTVSATPTPPIIMSPTNFSVTAEDGQINVSWEPPESGIGVLITKYNIYRNGTTGVYATVPGDQQWYVDGNITPGVTYTYQVTANDESREGTRSVEADVKAGESPSTPANLEIIVGDSFVYITWDTPLSDGGYTITNYSIYRGEIQGAEILLIRIGNESFFNDTNVTNGITYYYRVVAANSLGDSEISETANATPATVIVPANQPPEVSITSPLNGAVIKGMFEIFGTASDTDGIVQRVEIKIGDETWIQASGTTSWSHDWDTTAVSNGQYAIIVRAFDGFNYSSEINISVEVDNQESERSPLEDLWPWIMIIVIMSIFTSGFVIWTLKKKPATDMLDDEIFVIIQEKFQEGKISQETFEDFKKRYKKS
jgi:fibronectin type 3 domain-containing protein